MHIFCKRALWFALCFADAFGDSETCSSQDVACSAQSHAADAHRERQSTWLADFPKSPPWTISGRPCWRNQKSFERCCFLEFNSGCETHGEQQHCCSITLNGQGVQQAARPTCTYSNISESPHIYDQNSLGPFWLRERHHLVSFLLSELDTGHLSSDTVLPWTFVGIDEDREFRPFAEECLWGALALTLRSERAWNRSKMVVERLVKEPWVDAVYSGWPVFLLLFVLLPNRPLPVLSLMEQWMQTRAIIDSLKAFNDFGEATIKQALSVSDSMARPGSKLVELQRAASKFLAAWQQRVVDAPAELDILAYNDVWWELHRLQDWLVLSGPCPDGGFIATAFTELGEYRLCVRQQWRARSTSTSDALGSSYVDEQIIQRGKWAECSQAANMLPMSPKISLASQRCIVLDVGANVGSCALLFSRMGFSVIAVEPEPSNLKLLRASMLVPQSDASAFNNISLAPFAADREEGSADLIRNAGNMAASSIQAYTSVSAEQDRVAAANADSAAVQTVTLDWLATLHTKQLGASLTDICFLKMDIEGNELRALQGARKLLEGGVRVILFEFVPWSASQHSIELLQFLTGFGFTIYGLSGNADLVEERAYGPDEFESLIALMVKMRYIGNSLLAVKL